MPQKFFSLSASSPFACVITYIGGREGGGEGGRGGERESEREGERGRKEGRER